MATLIDRLLVNIDVNTQNMENGIRQIQRSLLSVGLSFLFTGMAIKRFFESMLNSMFTTFMNVEGETGPVSDMVNDILARLEFLKYSFIDAFVNTGAIQKWVDKAQELFDKFNNLTDAQKAFAVDFSIKAILIGGALMFIGQMFLGVLGIVALLDASIMGIPVIAILAAIALGVVFAYALLKIEEAWQNLKISILDMFIDLAVQIGTAITTFIINKLNEVISSINFVLGLLGKSKIDLIDLPNESDMNMAKFSLYDMLGVTPPVARISQPGVGSFGDYLNGVGNGISNVFNITIQGDVTSEDVLLSKMQKQLDEYSKNVLGSPQA